MPALNQSDNNYALPIIGLIAIVALAGAVWFGNKTPRTQPAVEGWTYTTQFHLPRRALEAVATATHVYVIGGMENDDRYVGAVEYAPILADGRLGAWQYTQPLGEPRFYLAAVAGNGYLYALGGANGERGKDNIPSAVVERAQILGDGSLGAWQRMGYLTTPRRGLQAAAYQNHLYAIGGYNGAFLKSIEHVEIKADGTLGDWQEDPEHAVVDRYIHSAAQLDDKLYLLGGHERSTRLPTVEFARVDADGGVAAWNFAAPLKEGRSAPAVATHGDTVYVLGGMGTAGALASVEMATQVEQGRLGHRAVK